MAHLERPVSPETLGTVAKEAIAALREAGVRCALFGSTALWALAGRVPSGTEDIDLLIEPHEAARAAEALADAGFRVEYPPEGWLIKAWRTVGERSNGHAPPEVLVDLVFRPSGLEVDDALFARTVPTTLEAVDVPSICFTDLLVSRLSALTEAALDLGPILEVARLGREQVEWKRVRRAVGGSPYARAFLSLVTELDLVPGSLYPLLPAPGPVAEVL